MKLIIAIVHSDDTRNLLDRLARRNFSATVTTSSGGFLRTSNATVFCGVEDERLEASREFFRLGSELGLPWEWRPLAGWGHAMNPQLDAAVRELFRTQLQAVGEKTDFFQSRY